MKKIIPIILVAVVLLSFTLTNHQKVENTGTTKVYSMQNNFGGLVLEDKKLFD